MASSKSEVIRLKLMVDTKKKRIPYAMVGKDFVKFVFTFLSLPVATVTRLLTKSSSNTGMVGCLGDLYKSLEEMEDFYETTFTGNKLYKDSALYPKVPFSVSSAAAKVPLLSPFSVSKVIPSIGF
ncbi:hypothetical protein TIFTF001_026366 [Ficus carica]|uniref:DUF674 family protein n=1 Tax=Ficus carica TaxID=3494 RepID=A0AA88DL09_FICCA|nr:hypothetical protein TIFTF001_026366 [Ficus carica]